MHVLEQLSPEAADISSRIRHVMVRDSFKICLLCYLLSFSAVIVLCCMSFVFGIVIVAVEAPIK